ncbi:putative ABC transport system ATP-binding protein [Austwickia chelonae]|uniref:Putative ABC transporter ATP-binding protein n=1 Tax=Austwickia chelonae NBRC 105200 TaxID=1184607 RepID=K6UNR0_9MICO|nr:ABC transporter ATP-binding protein [Austwickia chelonae]GAB79181.1 putative ABC transporter ATP-binding protein [Austwickia chelonae NBRC 105200]SEW37005.1 putative ABC transport system ATP-binding protein [Austwickia chelonae]
MNGVLSATDVHVSYGETPALRGSSLTLSSGEIVALVGPSGCGKSTLLMCLAGLQVPGQGTVRFGDLSLSEMSARHRRDFRARHLGFVLQFGELIAELSLLENALLPGLMRGASRRAAEAEARSLLEVAGVGALSGRLPAQVSGGQRQRAAIARALVGRPAFILADEPTGSLDSENAATAMDLLVAQARRHQVGVLVVTHERSQLSRYDRVVEMRDGVCHPEGQR